VTPRAILFDALGTLIELAPPAPRLRAELERRYGVRVDETDATRAMAAEIRFYRQHLDEGRDGASLAVLRERCAGELRAALPDAARHALPAPGELVDALLAALQFRPYPDAIPALIRYRERGVRLVVVSNWDVSLRLVLHNAGLARWLDGIVTAAEAGARKPAPAIFEQALGLAATRPEDAVHVGDSVDEDVVGARAAGIEPVLIRRGGGRDDGVRTIRTLSEPLY
jgi:putative hydrolase of the HAD superfamily